MDFGDCDYAVQQVVPRSREEKILNKNRDSIERARIAARCEHHTRYTPVDEIVKPASGTSFTIDDVDRFNRDYTQDQRTTKRMARELLLARASVCLTHQNRFLQWVEERRKTEAAQDAKVLAHVGQHDFLRESVLYDPVTCTLAGEETERGREQRTRDAQKETVRRARALKIQHDQSSTSYDPITGEQRTFW
jgi:hypothetical protein